MQYAVKILGIYFFNFGNLETLESVGEVQLINERGVNASSSAGVEGGGCTPIPPLGKP